MDKAAVFVNIYNNLPIKLREEAILVLNKDGQKQIFTWNNAYQEITNDTKLSKEILDKLSELNII